MLQRPWIDHNTSHVYVIPVQRILHELISFSKTMYVIHVYRRLFLEPASAEMTGGFDVEVGRN